MQKLSTVPFRAAKKTERKVGKGKGKETRPGSCKNPPRPRGRARYAEAGAAADELIDILGGNKGNDRGTWGYYATTTTSRRFSKRRGRSPRGIAKAN